MGTALAEKKRRCLGSFAQGKSRGRGGQRCLSTASRSPAAQSCGRAAPHSPPAPTSACVTNVFRRMAPAPGQSEPSEAAEPTWPGVWRWAGREGEKIRLRGAGRERERQEAEAAGENRLERQRASGCRPGGLEGWGEPSGYPGWVLGCAWGASRSPVALFGLGGSSEGSSDLFARCGWFWSPRE